MTTRKRVVVVEATRKRPAPEVQSISVLVLPDEDPDVSYLDQEEFTDRREAYQRGDFTFVGVRAQAEVVIEGIVQTIVSGGLWGIESDADAYIEEVAGEEYSDLRKILTSIGVSTSQLPSSMDRKWIEWRT
jgi:hypothetical protein